MNFDDAINAHVDWKVKLRTYIGKADKSLDANVVQQDNQCALGKWIYGEGAKHSAAPEYLTLKTEHAKFHRCAAAVVKTVDGGDKTKASSMIEAGTEYASASVSCVNAIRALRAKVGV